MTERHDEPCVLVGPKLHTVQFKEKQFKEKQLKNLLIDNIGNQSIGGGGTNLAFSALDLTSQTLSFGWTLLSNI